jgi:predicted Zn-dependent protease
LSELEAWRGKFRQSIAFLQKALVAEKLLGDSSRIANTLFGISSAYDFLDQKDSALAYIARADKVAINFQRMSVPIKIASIDRTKADSVRPAFKASIDMFKSRLPSELWPLADALTDLFDAMGRADTAALITQSLRIAQLQSNQDNTANLIGCGELMIRAGRYAEGKKLLEENAIGENESTGGWEQPHRWYLLGRAYEGLNDRTGAVKYYGEMLKYWGNPDVDVKEITDARARLAKMQS